MDNTKRPRVRRLDPRSRSPSTTPRTSRGRSRTRRSTCSSRCRCSSTSRTRQPEAFREVRRIARHAIMSLPIDWDMDDPAQLPPHDPRGARAVLVRAGRPGPASIEGNAGREASGWSTSSRTCAALAGRLVGTTIRGAAGPRRRDPRTSGGRARPGRPRRSCCPCCSWWHLPQPLDQPFGKDVALYRDAASRWLAGGPFYEPRQLAGPYEVAHGDILYPPVGLWLFVPAADPAGAPGARAVVGHPRRGHDLGDPSRPPASRGLAADRAVPRLADDAAQDLDRQPGHLVHGRDGRRDRLARRRAVRAAQAEPVPVRAVRHPASGRGGSGSRSSSRCAVPFGAMWLDWVARSSNSRGGGPALLGARGADAGAPAGRLGRTSTPPAPGPSAPRICHPRRR